MSRMEDDAVDEEVLERNYGDVDLKETQSGCVSGKWKEAVSGGNRVAVSSLKTEKEHSDVVVSGRVHSYRQTSSNLGFLVLREKWYTVQCVASKKSVGSGMMAFLKNLSKESFVEVVGIISIPKKNVTGTTEQQVEIKLRKVYCISRAISKLPLDVEAASKVETEEGKGGTLATDKAETATDKAETATDKCKTDKHKGGPLIGLDTRLNHRVLDLRTPANQAIFRVRSHLENSFRQFLVERDFVSIHTPKLLAGKSEGGASVFCLDYFGKEASLAQSAQLHKQMAISSGFTKVFDIGTYFRAEKSSTNRHLTEFVCLNVEMQLENHYSEVMHLVEELFRYIVTEVKRNCASQLETIKNHHKCENLKFVPIRLLFEEGIRMLEESGEKIDDPLADLSRESEKKLGKLVLDKYQTDFFVLYRFPLAARPFFTMPCSEDDRYSNSFDVFIRGEEIISGAQRIHDPAFLKQSAEARGINVETISSYLESFKYGTPLHGGFGAGLDRVVMLFLGLKNIRNVSLFPRDPQRLGP